MHHLSLLWEKILSSKASGLSRLHTREQGPYLDDWGCSSEEIEAKVKELGLESVAQVVSLDACRNTEWPKLNDTGMILFGGNTTEYHFHGLGVDLDHKVFELIGCNDVFALNSSWLSSESLDISPEMEDQVDDECGALPAGNL